MNDDTAGSASRRKKKHQDSRTFQPDPAAKELLDHIAELLAREYIELLEESAESKDESGPRKEKE